MSDEKFITEFERLIGEGFEILEDGGPLGSLYISNTLNTMRIRRFQASSENILRLRFKATSPYYIRFKEVKSIKIYKELEEQVPILQSALDALKMGLTEDLFYQRELITCREILDQAIEFFDHNQYQAFAIYGRIVIETTVREFAKLKWNGFNPNIKFNDLIIQLTKNNIIPKPFEDILRANYTIGSYAIHSDEKFSDYSNKKEIRKFKTFIENEILTLK